VEKRLREGVVTGLVRRLGVKKFGVGNGDLVPAPNPVSQVLW